MLTVVLVSKNLNVTQRNKRSEHPIAASTSLLIASVNVATAANCCLKSSWNNFLCIERLTQDSN